MNGKIVLVRFDHNVVKKGIIKDPFRIDKTLGTLYYIVDRGGRPVIMTHIGRPKDKKTGKITFTGALFFKAPQASSVSVRPMLS